MPLAGCESNDVNAPKLIALSLAVATALSACKQDKPAEPAASAPPPATAAAAPAIPSFDVSELDKNIDACNDFNGFVNAKWVKANPIPHARTRWGAYTALA